MDVTSQYQDAIAEVGPSPTLIARKIKATVDEVYQKLNLPEIQKFYEERVEEIVDAMKQFGANQTILATVFDVPRHYVSFWITENLRLRTIHLDFSAMRVDIAEYQLDMALANGERWAIEYTLRTQGADRGWGERVQVDLASELRRLGYSEPGVIAEVARLLADKSADQEDEDVIDV